MRHISPSRTSNILSLSRALTKSFVPRGVQGNPGRETISNWFKIEKYDDDDDYKLVFCPTVCNYCKVIFKEVGVLVEDGVRRLTLTDTAYVQEGSLKSLTHGYTSNQHRYHEIFQLKKVRMDIEVTDYSGTDANNHHDPKPPPGSF